MQDRFKFRVWCCNNNEWEKDEILISNKDLFKIYRHCECRMVTEEPPKHHIIEQCTGLKDKNGKLIYEGDIIVVPNEYPFYDCKHTDGEPVLNYIGIVKWIYNCWQYEYQCVNPKKSGISNGINNLLNEFGFDDDELSDFEVIGNIHETPELLEQKNDAD